MPDAREKILVVEDDPSLAMGLLHNLKFEGFDVSLARDGETGLRMACDNGPDLVILDVMLPGIDGFEVLSELRRAGLEMQILMLTARASDEDKIQGLGLGADDYITKPFSLRELIARVNAALRRVRLERAEAAARPVVFADIVIDLKTRTVRKAGEPRRLSQKEFELLMFMARNPGRVLTREEILKVVWGWDYDGTDRTVDNFIRALRAALEDDPSNPFFFRTAFGAGYIFNMEKPTAT
ncbi:MAG TPA: response regulator transcription factor [Myxococcota bacterium]|nr:response regulator transcription factor [Myxococcota bacterium]